MITQTFETLAERAKEIVNERFWHMETASQRVEEVVARTFPEEAPVEDIPQPVVETTPEPTVPQVVSLTQKRSELEEAEAKVAAAFEEAA